MNQTKQIPKVFISYSWQPISNKIWVIEFADRLTRDGIHVVIDEWDATEGEDKYVFMEKMVNDSDINKVLLICNKEYAEKANNKKGGVGIESQIISNEIYSKVDQKKFIPIVREYFEGKACLPTFVASRFFIDLSDDESFEDNYEHLLRNIFDKPKSRRPPIGEPPSYLTEKDQVFLRTAHKIKPLKDALIKDKSNSKAFVNDYLITFVDSIKDFRFPMDFQPDQTIDELILSRISELKLLRDDYLDFLKTYLTYSSSIEFSELHGFFEKILEQNPEIITDDYFKYDHLKFFINELFIYTIAFLLKKELFKGVSYLLHNKYIIYLPNYRKTEIVPFNGFNTWASLKTYC